MSSDQEPKPDPVEGGEGSTQTAKKKGAFAKRYIVAIMVFLGICVQYALRVNLSVAIGAMCNNRTVVQNGFTIHKVKWSSSRISDFELWKLCSRQILRCSSILFCRLQNLIGAQNFKVSFNPSSPCSDVG